MKTIFSIENGEFIKKGTLFPENLEQIILYEVDDKSRPIKELGRIKL